MVCVACIGVFLYFEAHKGFILACVRAYNRKNTANLKAAKFPRQDSIAYGIPPHYTDQTTDVTTWIHFLSHFILLRYVTVNWVNQACEVNLEIHRYVCSSRLLRHGTVLLNTLFFNRGFKTSALTFHRIAR